MKPINDKNVVEMNAKCEQLFSDERENWNIKIEDLIKQLYNPDMLTDTIVLVHSYRQQLIEKINTYRQKLAKLQNKYDIDKVQRYQKYMVESDLKLTASERNDAVNADLKASYYTIQLLSNQISFIDESIKNLIDLKYSIKNKITLLTEFN